MSANSERLDQLEEGNAVGGHASAVEAILRPAASASSPRMTSRRFPTPWRADKIAGGYVVRDASRPKSAGAGAQPYSPDASWARGESSGTPAGRKLPDRVNTVSKNTIRNYRRPSWPPKPLLS
jgi:hypothetical protein